MFRVDDVKAVLDAARAGGADAAAAASDWPYGESQAGMVDPFGHRWVLTQTMADVNPRDWGRRDGRTAPVTRCLSLRCIGETLDAWNRQG
jgi:hypothetical protein